MYNWALSTNQIQKNSVNQTDSKEMYNWLLTTNLIKDA